jgi:hypothetical protein
MMPRSDSIETIGSGILLTNGTEQTIMDYSDDMSARFWGVLDLVNMQAGERFSATVFGTLSDLGGGGGAQVIQIKNEFPRVYTGPESADLRSRVVP